MKLIILSIKTNLIAYRLICSLCSALSQQRIRQLSHFSPVYRWVVAAGVFAWFG